MVEFRNSPVSFILKVLGEFVEIPDSSKLFFSANSLPDFEKNFPKEVEESLVLSVNDTFDCDSKKFKFQYFQGTNENIPVEMSKLYLGENCIGIYLNIENYLALKPVNNWLKELNKFWVLEPKEAIVYQESGLTLGFKIKPDSHFKFFGMDEMKALEILGLFTNESQFSKMH